MFEFFKVIFVVFSNITFKQAIGTPMGTNSASLLANLLLYLYEADFMQTFFNHSTKHTDTHFDNIISLNNPNF